MSRIYLLLSLLCIVFTASAQSTSFNVVAGGCTRTNSVYADLEEKSVQPVLPCTVERLMRAYPQTIVGYSNGALITVDGRRIAYNDTIFSVSYPKGVLSTPPTTDPGRIRDETLLKAMYGFTPEDVKLHLLEITWCPKLVGQKLQVTTRNNVHLALQKVSDELDRNPKWKKYLRSSGTYLWRTIAGTDRLSTHSFGIAIDLGVKYSHYWRWDYPNADESTPISYHNKIPQGIINVFEKHGFIWGGKWMHYDTMHFEYRPELL